jgi:Mn2+/Fe2+ NRAMP family transporter
LFTLGIVGTGLLAVPVLAGSAAYAVGEAFKWPTGVDRKPPAAKGFYGVLTVSTLLGLAINFLTVQKITHLTPIKALFWSAVINGVVAVPIMVIVMLMAKSQSDGAVRADVKAAAGHGLDCHCCNDGRRGTHVHHNEVIFVNRSDALSPHVLSVA